MPSSMPTALQSGQCPEPLPTAPVAQVAAALARMAPVAPVAAAARAAVLAVPWAAAPVPTALQCWRRWHGLAEARAAREGLALAYRPEVARAGQPPAPRRSADHTRCSDPPSCANHGRRRRWSTWICIQGIHGGSLAAVAAVGAVALARPAVAAGVAPTRAQVEVAWALPRLWHVPRRMHCHGDSSSKGST